LAEHGSRVAEFVKIRAERKLQEVAIALCVGLTPQHMETMAQRNLTLADLLRETGHTIPKVSWMARPGVDHLARLSDEEILRILEEVVPGNTSILRRHPIFCHSVIRDLKAFATG
jgi:hypothetical protein